MDSDFEKNIFINCPFDEEYRSLFRPMLFTILYYDFNPCIANEESNSGNSRIDKLKDLIFTSKYSIHDISRLISKKKKEYSRMNMPFELGIDFGCKCFVKEKELKKFLILEKDKYSSLKAISDLNGFDLKAHNNSPEEIVRTIRDWFIETIKVKVKGSPTKIWGDFNDFCADLQTEKEQESYSQKDIDLMPIPELISNMKEWLIKSNKNNFKDNTILPDN
jgi:hypothetical protein